MKCNSCGVENDVGTKFCANCGSLLNRNPEHVDPASPAIPELVFVASVTQTVERTMVSEVMIGGIVASCLFLLGVFLPFTRIVFSEFSLIQIGLASEGGIALALGLLALSASISKRPVTILIIGIINTGFIVLKTVTLSSSMIGSSNLNIDTTKMVNYSAGYYCLWIGAVILIIVGTYGMIKGVNGNKNTK